jgi:hypothetical protein
MPKQKKEQNRVGEEPTQVLLSEYPEEHQALIGFSETCLIAAKITTENEEFAGDTLQITVRSIERDDFVQTLSISEISKEDVLELAKLFKSLANSMD